MIEYEGERVLNKKEWKIKIIILFLKKFTITWQTLG